MLKAQFALGTLSVGLMVLGAGMASGQDYPNRSIRIVTAAPGGGVDFVARLIAQGLSGSLGQQVIVDNRGIIAAEMLAKAPPDGYTLLVYGDTVYTAPLLQKTPYDPVRDFAPISLLAGSPNILVVHPSLPVKSIKGLMALAKARPGQLNYSSASSGSSSHIAAELFKSMAGVNIVHVAYKGAGPAFTAVIGGETQLMFATAGAAAPHIKSGKLTALAVTSGQPSALVPGVPTVAASGLSGFESGQVYGAFAPAKTAGPIIFRLNQEIVRFLGRADVKEKFFSLGVEAVGSSPEQLAARIKSEMERMGRVITDAGIKIE